MNIVYLGSGEFGIPCLEALRASDHRLSLVVTQPAHPAGRGRRPQPTPVARWADAHRVPLAETDNVNSAQMIERIAAQRPDLLVVIAFGQKVGRDLVELPPNGAINVHASLLPKLRGAAPINWAIVRGETHTGISIITLAEKIDAGDILAQTRTAIAADETAGALHDRLAQVAAPLLLETLGKIQAGTATYTKQDQAEVTFAPKLRKTDGVLDFGEPADVLARRIRGLWPWPGASAYYLSAQKSGRVVIALADVVPEADVAPSPAGTFDEDLNVICGQGRLKIVKLKPAGSGLMDFRDFANGWRVQAGDRLVKIEE